MAPRSQTLRPAQTAAAREAMKSFFCELCQKGYSRMNEYEAHLSSYDHSHKQRLKDMKAMVRDPTAAARARRQEAKATDVVVSIKLGAETGGANGGGMAGPEGAKKGGFRKGGFKSAFVSVNVRDGGTDQAIDVATGAPADSDAQTSVVLSSTSKWPALGSDVESETDNEDEDNANYDPHYPTD